MIQLRSDCLVFEVSGGDKIPCSVEKLTIEVLADSLDKLDPDAIRQAATAVLHYFREDLGRQTVTVDEFTAALEHVLAGLGYEVCSTAAELGDALKSAKPPVPALAPAAPAAAVPSGEERVANGDLAALAAGSEDALELGFYPRLRTELRGMLAGEPRVVCFHGLRRCAMRLAGTHRWCPRSVAVSDDIVRFLRECWRAERPGRKCALMVD